MALARLKQNDIIKKSVEIEEIIEKKIKISSGTFGSKLKIFQEKEKNSFLISALWNLVQTRNHIAHRNDFEISLKEYNLFIANYEYVKKFLK